MDVPLIEFKDVTKRFGRRTILERINLKIYEEQVTTIIGLSGSGKSVLLKHIIGLLKPDEGIILFRGIPLHQMGKKGIAACLGQMSYMFQGDALFDSMTVYENVATLNSGNDELEQTGNRSQGHGQNRTGRARRSGAEISLTDLGGDAKASGTGAGPDHRSSYCSF